MKPSPLFLSLSFLLLAAPALADDTVFLKNGGRVRGTIVESDPSTSTRIKLLDGTMKTIKAADIDHIDTGDAKPAPAPAPAPSAPIAAPPPPPAAIVGSIRIESEEPGTASIDGGEIGKTPATAHDLAPGRHKIRVDFDAGGAAEKFVMIQPGDNEEVKLEPSAARKVARYREGIHFGARAAVVAPIVDLDAGGLAFAGLLGGFMNIGISPALDLRVGASLGYGRTNSSPALFYRGVSGAIVPLILSGDLRFNLGSVYTVSVGARGGMLFVEKISDESKPCDLEGSCDTSLSPFGFVGPTWSVLGLRLGERRSIEVEFTQGFDFLPSIGKTFGIYGSIFDSPVYHQEFSIGYLF